MSLGVDSSADPLNSVILGARKQLQEIGKTLQQPAVDYDQVISELSEATSQLKSEADAVLTEKYTESNILPIQQPHQKNLIEHVRANSTPKEVLPFKSTRALELRKKYANPIHPVKRTPKVTSINRAIPALELIQKGIINESDDLSSLIPPIDPSVHQEVPALIPGIAIDIHGAAEASRKKREQRQLEIQKFKQTLEKFQEISQDESSREKLEIDEQEIDIPPVQEKIQPSPRDSKTEIQEEKPAGPRIYEELQDEFAYQTLLIVRGKIARETPDFESFQRTNTELWKQIDAVLIQIEEFCANFGIQYAEIDGRKLSEAAHMDKVGYNEVYSCLVGVDEFIQEKQQSAARIIHKNMRIYLEKIAINKRKKLSKAAYRIQQAFRNYLRKISLPARDAQRTLNIEGEAADLAESLRNKFTEITQDEHVFIHCITSMQDYCRVLDLLHKKTSLILLVTALPPSHVWEDFLEYLAECGIFNANERINFCILRELNSGNGMSHKMNCDLRTIRQIQRFAQGRETIIIPHADWLAERRLSVDISIPIFGPTDTSICQSRAYIRSFFAESGIVCPLATNEHRDVIQLLLEAIEMMKENPDLSRFIIHLGFSQSESAIAWFDFVPEFLQENADILKVLKKNLNVSPPATVSSFISHISQVGATIEGVPEIIQSFPSVSLLLTGNELKTIGTYDRMHFAPYRFGANMVPAISVDNEELVGRARQVGSVMMRSGLLGYITIDFLAYNEDRDMKIMGLDIRTNSWPSVLRIAYNTLLAGFDGRKLKLLRNIGDDKKTPERFVVIQSGVSHPGFAKMGLKELRRTCYNNGMLFDLRNRLGFKMVFLDSLANGKNFIISSGITSDNAISLMEKNYSALIKFFGPKVGSDLNNSLSNGLASIRYFKTRMNGQ